MRVRAHDAAGDYQFGRAGVFLVDVPEAVAQVIQTRFALWQGSWFMDSEEGTPFLTEILGHGSRDTRDLAIRQRILDTPGVTALNSYSSRTDNRALSVTVNVQTQFSATGITVQV